MTIQTLLFFIPACFALNMAPGPNNLLSVANATRYGFAAACFAGLGRLLAFVFMIAIAATGLAVVLQASEAAFYVIKIAGAAYLFYIAVQLWRAPTADASGPQEPSKGLMALAKQEFFVAAGNPKAILIFTAFFPQFVSASEPSLFQFATLGTLFLALEWVAIAAYSFVGSHLRKWFAKPKRRQVFNRVCGALLGAAGLGLLVARRSASGT